MRRLLLPSILTAALTTTAAAQWTIQPTPTTADLRGIDNVGNGIAWASGTNGTILHTTDNGTHWQRCTTPPNADHLDFRGIQAFDANTAIVMSSGKGDLSRLYKTTDACQTWKLMVTNPDPDGFWDAVKFYNELIDPGSEEALILGDSVKGKVKLWEWKEGWKERELEPHHPVRGNVLPGESSFAASNSVLQITDTAQIDEKWNYEIRWASETDSKAMINYVRAESTSTCEPCILEVGRVEVPMAGGTNSAGIFSFMFRSQMIGVAVGGDYLKPDTSSKVAVITSDAGLTWSAPATPPHGYRSAVAYDAPTKTWITVGPNGTDISTDDGRNWRALKPSQTDAPDADQHWNALSLPFVVGPHGRIGHLRQDILTPTPKSK